jgi:hypothetical protein
MKQPVVYVSVPVTKSVLLKIANNGNEIPAVLEAWAEEGKSTNMEAPVDKHFQCFRKKNQRITEEMCLNRLKTKKYGCPSCKTGKLIKKIHDLQDELKKMKK